MRGPRRPAPPRPRGSIGRPADLGPWDPNTPWEDQQRRWRAQRLEWRRRQRLSGQEWREMQQRLRAAHRMQRAHQHRAWYRRTAERGFGCLFGLLFLVFVASVVTVGVAVLSAAGPLPALIVAAVVVVALVVVGRRFARAAWTLDRLVTAVRAVESGDYSVRIQRTPHQTMRVVRELSRGFDTMAARLEADEEQRRLLLADVSHELRTPLTIIAGHLEAILDGVHPADAQHLQPILDETRVMERLIEDLRTLALSEAGNLPLHREPTEPAALVSDIVRSFGPQAQAAGLHLTEEVEGGLPSAEVDPVRIREVLANLVANAIRHTPAAGTVTVSATRAQDRLRLTVSDTGRGIDPTLLPYVFDRFVKGERSRGSGLGLAIARGLTEAHGGAIAVRSEAGRGTTFEVQLPFEPEAA
ncbi:MAG TPA: HAMP domain-containing sensor histidine kinase [Candidatus Limnocylindrales bacterium]|nr:HAMP domain-containing sensor histidine kinase [Candidatus Limnocylindrales bacterium]